MKILKLDKRHLNIMAQIDLESKHQMEEHLKLKDYKKMLKERFKKNQEAHFGYKENNKIKGYISMKPFFPGYKHCEIYWLSVSYKYQGQGIGTKLLQHIEKYAKKQGFRKVCLYTNKVLKKTRRFYEKNGYKKVNEFQDYYGYGKQRTTVLYCKNI